MDRGKWIAAVSMIVSFAVLDMAAATAPALNVPSVGTTGLTGTVPSSTVTVPSVSTPSVNTPAVSTPHTTVPKVSSPSVSKDLQLTKVSTPTVTTPSTVDPVTSVRRVTAQTPAGGAARTVFRVTSAPQSAGGATGTFVSGTGDSSSGQSTDGGAGDGLPPGSNAALPGSGTGSAGGPGGGLGAFPGPMGQTVPGLHAFAFLPGGAAALRLRATVEPLLGCFYSLSPFEQEVLTLRAGLDGGAPISRGQLASAFGVTPIDVHRTERSALRRLRRASAADGCVGVAASGFAAIESAFIGGPFGPVGYVSPATGSTIRSAVAITPIDVPGRAVQSRSIADRLEELSGDSGSGPHWMVFLITLLLCASLGGLLREARRSV